MIPRIIHYCWFGRGEKPKSAKTCIASWKKHMPDYKVIEWNEDNFDINLNPYTKMCYDQRKYAFLTDYVRLIIIEKYGGIYFDTDVEAVRSFDELLNCGLFIGFETNTYVNTGEGFGAEAHHDAVKAMISKYDKLLNGLNGTIGCPRLNTDAMLEMGMEQNGKFQKLRDDIIVYPSEYFNPLDSATGILKKTSKTYSIHWYSASWMSWHRRLRGKITRPLHRIQALFRK